MKKISIRFNTIVILALLLGVLVWRLWPRSLESLSGLDFDQAISVSAHTKTTVFESGTPIFITHELDDEDITLGTEHFAPVLDGFRTIKARPSLSNLLRPWLLTGNSWTGPVDFLYGFVSCGDTATTFYLTDRGELSINARLYFITDDDQFNTLWDYVTAHGIENKS